MPALRPDGRASARLHFPAIAQTDRGAPPPHPGCPLQSHQGSGGDHFGCKSCVSPSKLCQICEEAVLLVSAIWCEPRQRRGFRYLAALLSDLSQNHPEAGESGRCPVQPTLKSGSEPRHAHCVEFAGRCLLAKIPRPASGPRPQTNGLLFAGQLHFSRVVAWLFVCVCMCVCVRARVCVYGKYTCMQCIHVPRVYTYADS
jgi:hypothetical protein